MANDTAGWDELPWSGPGPVVPAGLLSRIDEVVGRLAKTLSFGPPAPPVDHHSAQQALAAAWESVCAHGSVADCLALRAVEAELAELSRLRAEEATRSMTRVLRRLAAAVCSVPELIHLIPQFICELGFSRGLISRVEEDLWTPQLMFVVDDPVWAQTLTRMGSAHPQRLHAELWETELVRTRRSIIAVDVQRQPWRSHAGLASASGTRSYVAAPLIRDEEVVGILHAERYGQRRDVDEFDRQLLECFAEAAQLALSRAALLEAVESVDERVAAVGAALTQARSTAGRIPRLALEPDSPDGARGLIVRGGTGDQLSQPLPPDLSPRELEVLRLMAAGKSNATIAYQLSIAEGTVKQHVKHVLRKLLVGTRAEAVSRWYQAGGKY